jgi:hypothetical protein
MSRTPEEAVISLVAARGAGVVYAKALTTAEWQPGRRDKAERCLRGQDCPRIHKEGQIRGSTSKTFAISLAQAKRQTRWGTVCIVG